MQILSGRNPPPGFTEFLEISVPRKVSHLVKNHREQGTVSRNQRKQQVAEADLQNLQIVGLSETIQNNYAPYVLINKRSLEKVSKEQMNLENNHIEPLEVKDGFSSRGGF